MFHTILLGVGGKCYILSIQLGLDHQCAIKLAHKTHPHSVKHANKLVTTRRAIENNVQFISTSHSQVLEPGASSNPPDNH
eukprot:1149480-Pelagomonas_calceolata.AAC.1